MKNFKRETKGYLCFNLIIFSRLFSLYLVNSKYYLFIFFRMRIRFYHVPKSGGTAIYNMTKKWKNFKRAHPNKNHIQIYKYPPGLNEIGLTIIRHPYSRFISAFYHMVDSCNQQFYYRYAAKSDCEELKKMGVDFNETFQRDPNYFLEALVNYNHIHHKDAKKVFNHFSIFKSQFYWLGDVFGFGIHPSIKIILHQENLKHEFDHIASQLGEYPIWPVGNQANQRLTKDNVMLSSASKKAIQKLYKDDFKHLNFEA